MWSCWISSHTRIGAPPPGDPLSFPLDPTSFAQPLATDLSTLRVAFSEDLGFAPVEPEMRQALRYSFADVAEAHSAHSALYARFGAFMADYDILLCPVTAAPAFNKTELFPGMIDGVQARIFTGSLPPTASL